MDQTSPASPALFACDQCGFAGAPEHELDDVVKCAACGAWHQVPMKPIQRTPSANRLPVQVMPVAAAQPAVVVIYAKSRMVHVLLALFLGTLGLHNFYSGRIPSGVCQLAGTMLVTLFNLVTFGFGLLLTFPWFVVLLIVNVLEACFVSTDAYGNRLA